MARKNVPADDGDDDDKYAEAASKEIDAIKAKEEAGEDTEEAEEKPSRHLVDLDADPEEDEEPKENAAARRRNRYREAKEATETHRREAEQAREEARVANLRAEAMALAMQRGGQSQGGPDPIEAELTSIDDENTALRDHFYRLPEQEQTARLPEFRKKEQLLERRRLAAVVRQQSAGAPAAPNAADMFMLTNFPEVHTHPSGPALVRANMQRLVALGRPQDFNTFREAAETTKGDLGLGKAPKRQATTGARPSGSSMKAKLSYSGGGGGGTAPSKGRVIDMGSAANKQHRKMAEELYPQMKPEKAYRVYAREYLSGEDDD